MGGDLTAECQEHEKGQYYEKEHLHHQLHQQHHLRLQERPEKMMADYIRTQENAEELMAEFETAKLMFGGKYPLVKKWFLDTFKDDADTFKVSEAKKQIATAKVNRVKATVKLVSGKKNDEAAA